MQLDGSQGEPRGICVDWRKKILFFDSSLGFLSKFRGVKHPDRSKYSSFIPVDNNTSIFGGKQIEQRASNRACPEVELMDLENVLRASSHFFDDFFAVSVRQPAAAVFTLGLESRAFPFHPSAIIGGLTGIKQSAWKPSCLCDSGRRWHPKPLRT